MKKLLLFVFVFVSISLNAQKIYEFTFPAFKIMHDESEELIRPSEGCKFIATIDISNKNILSVSVGEKSEKTFKEMWKGAIPIKKATIDMSFLYDNGKEIIEILLAPAGSDDGDYYFGVSNTKDEKKIGYSFYLADRLMKPYKEEFQKSKLFETPSKFDKKIINVYKALGLDFE